LYLQAVQCHDAFTQIISQPQRGQELSAVVDGRARSPGWQGGGGGAGDGDDGTVAPAPDDQAVSSIW
jgi:hypothetical protein